MLKHVSPKYTNSITGNLNVFITYSTVDKEFTEWLSYKIEQAEIKVFINDYSTKPSDNNDEESKSNLEKWQKKIEDMIIRSDFLLYIISPDVINSEICNEELDFAKQLNKKIIPIVWREPANLKIPEILSSDSYLHFTNEDELDQQVRKLVKQLSTDNKWVRQHTYYTVKALRWAEDKKCRRKLLSKKALERAEKWRDVPPKNALPLTPLLGEYISASHKAAELPRSLMNGLLMLSLIAAIVISVYGWSRSGLAVLNEERALKSEKLAVDALDKVKAQRDSVKKQIKTIKQQATRQVEIAIKQMQQAKLAAQKQIELTKQSSENEIHKTKLSSKKEIDQIKLSLTKEIERTKKERSEFKKQSEEALLTQSRMLTFEANQQLNKENAVTATLLSLAALQDKKSTNPIQKVRPVYAPAKGILNKAIRRIVEKAVLRGHQNGVTSVTFSPDGTRLVSGAQDNTIRVWDTVTGKQLNVLKGHIASVMSVDISTDNAKIVSGSMDSTLKLWDLKTGKALAELRGHGGAVTSVQFSPDGTKIISGSFDTTLRIWEVKTGKLLFIFRGHKRDVTSVSFSEDGTKIASASYDTTVKIWDVKKLQLLSTLEGHDGWVMSVQFSPDDRAIASASRDQTIRIWSVKGGKQLSTLKGHNDWIIRAAFSPDGHHLVTASRDNTTKIWDLETAKELTTRKGHSRTVTTVQFSPDGQTIVTASEDQTIRIWYAKLGEHLLTLNHLSDNISDDQNSSDEKNQNFTQEYLILTAKNRVTRCLSPRERKQFYLSATPPRWCITGPGNEKANADKWIGKPPYNTKQWQNWLQAKDAGKPISIPR